MLPEAEALGRWFGTGEKRFEDAEVFWQKGSDKYVRFLKEESFEQGLRRVYMPSELLMVMGNTGTVDPTSPDIIRLFARTRRFSKLLADVGQNGAIGAMDNAVDPLPFRAT